MVYKKYNFIGGKLVIYGFFMYLCTKISSILEPMNDNFFPYAQFGGCVTFSLLSAMLIFSRTYKTKHKSIHKRARTILTFSQVILAVQFFLQFSYGWRQTDPEKAIICNMVFFPLAGLCMIFSLLFMFTKGHINHKAFFWSSWTYIAMIALLIYAYLNPNILYPVECFGAIVYTILFVALGLYVDREFKSVRTRMDNYFSQDTTSHVQWMARTIVAVVGLVICVPFAVLSNSAFLKCITLLNFVAIFFYVNRFIYYSYDIQMMIDRYFEVIEADTQPEHPASENSITATHEGSPIGTILEIWLEKKAYIEPEITIEDLVKQTGLRRTALANYLNMNLGLSFRSWLNCQRIDEAKKIMTEHPDYSHETIAELSGFSSRTYFLKVFKDKEGIPPGDWMEKQLASANK